MAFLALEARPTRSRAMVLLSPFMAITLTIAAGSVLFTGLGFHPLEVIIAFFVTPISTGYGLSELGVKATPLVLCAAGLALGFRANVWNIGAEGQLTIGAITGGGLALALGETEGIWVLPAMFIAALIGGMLWAAIPAYLRTRHNTSEILTSLMLTYVALLLLSYLVHGPWKDPDGFSFPESKLFSASATLPIILEGTRLHVGGLVTLGIIAAAWVLTTRLFVGFQLNVVGATPAAAAFAGFSTRRVIWGALLTSGALAGLAGLFEVAGPIGQLLPSISPGYGFTAIIVAFLGRLHPLGVVLAGLLVALSYLGGESVQIELGMPKAAAGVFQGMLLFFLLATDILVRYRIRLNTRAPSGANAG